eukprot:RCo009884
MDPVSTVSQRAPPPSLPPHPPTQKKRIYLEYIPSLVPLELVHRVRDPEEVHEPVIDRGGHAAAQAGEPHKARHVQHLAAALDRLDHLERHVLRLQDGEEEGEPGLHPVKHSRVDVVRAHAGRRNALLAQLAKLEPQGLVEPKRAELRRTVVRQPAHPDQARGTGDGHNVAAIAMEHVGKEGLHRPKVRSGVHIHCLAGQGVRDVQELLPADDAGVVYQHVNVPEVADNQFCSRVHGVGVADVADVHLGLTALLLDHPRGLLGHLLVEVPHGDLAALLRELQAHQPANTHPSSCDDHHLAFQAFLTASSQKSVEEQRGQTYSQPRRHSQLLFHCREKTDSGGGEKMI